METEPSVVIVIRIRVKCERRWIVQLQHNAFHFPSWRGVPNQWMQTSVHIFCPPRCSCSSRPRSSSSTSSPLISSQQKELKSISSAKVMCSCSWVNKNGNDFITIISSSRWWKWKVSPVCAVSELTNGNFNFNIKKPRESSRRPKNRQEAQRSLEKLREASRSPEKPREAMSKPEKTREASRGLEKNRGDPRKLYWRLLRTLWISRRFVISSTVRMFASRASENYGWGVEEPNPQTEVKQGASSTLLDFIVTPIQFQISLTVVLDWLQYTFTFHDLLLYIEHWKVVM